MLTRKTLPVALLVLFAAASTFAGDDRAKIVEGVQSIAVPGIPGPICVFKDAFTIVATKVDGVPAPLIGSAKFGKGHLVALGHEGYFSKQSIETADTKRLLTNLIEHAASGRADAKGPIRVAHFGRPEIEALASDRFVIAWAEWNPDAFAKDCDVLVCAAGQISVGDTIALEQFVKQGGGLICGVPGWGWLQTHKGKTLDHDFPANDLFGIAGLAWADGMIDVPGGRKLSITDDLPKYLNASVALSALRDNAKLSRNEANIAVSHVMRCLESVPAARFPELSEITHADVMSLPVPSAERPVTNESGLARIKLAAHLKRIESSPPGNLRAERAAEMFPGKVPETAPRIAREVTINSAIPGWQSTGLYAAPGERVTVHLATGSAVFSDCHVRIGAHSDRLWHLASWKRAPQIDRTFPITAPQLEIASGFGGLIYVVLPDALEPKKFTVTISGAVEAPYFVLGKTDPKDWRERIRKLPAPWAELQSDKIIITIPSEHVRNLDDPTELMKFWDRVADACADLATIPRERKRPERYVADVQISAGYMHAGYPIMTHLDAAPRFVDLAKLQSDGDWGMFHEIGHNHQHKDWTFDGTGEVTVNLFTMYVLDTVCTNGMDVKLHKAMSPDSRAAAEKKYKENGSKFEQWKSEPFTALIMYKQLQEAFGWDAYKKVFAEYRALKDDERPKTDDERRDQWMVRFSRTVGKNLGPFFEYWGVPTSESARKSIEDLPAWMPADR